MKLTQTHYLPHWMEHEKCPRLLGCSEQLRWSCSAGNLHLLVQWSSPLLWGPMMPSPCSAGLASLSQQGKEQQWTTSETALHTERANPGHRAPLSPSAGCTQEHSGRSQVIFLSATPSFFSFLTCTLKKCTLEKFYLYRKK
jgi:hypothetical protein